MGVSVLAAGDVVGVAGRLTFLLGIPLIGLICLTIGLWTRSRSRRQLRPAYPYAPGPPPMGYPGPYPPAPYPGTPYPGYPPYLPPQPRTATSATALIIIGSVVLALGGLGILGNIAFAASQRSHASSQTRPSGAAAEPQIGQCFTDWDVMDEFNTTAKASDCADPRATEELVFKGDSTATCPDGRRQSSVYDVYFNASSTLCFAANLTTGQCYMKMQDSKQTHLTPVDCDDARFAQIKVLQRINGSTDATLCPPGSKGISYPSPARTYCIVKAGT